MATGTFGTMGRPGGGFGQKTTSFGQQAAGGTQGTFGTPTTAWGQKPGGFGATGGTGGFGQKPAGFGQQAGGFGGQQAAGFGQKPAGFGQAAGGFGGQQQAAGGFGQRAGGFGQQTTGGFGGQQQAAGGFGQAAGGFGAKQGLPAYAPLASEEPGANGTKPIKVSITAITAMPAYAELSVEQLRWMQIKGEALPQQAAGGFGQQQTTTGGFGAKPGGFGSTAAGGFGQQQQTTTGGFGAKPGGFGSTAAGGFGQQQTTTGGFGAKPGGFGSTAAGGFGQQQQTTTGGFGAKPGGFGSTAAGGFGQQQTTTGGFGAKPGGFGSTAAGGFGGQQQTTTGGFGAKPGGFGSTAAGGFGGQQAAGGFGAKPGGFGSTAAGGFGGQQAAGGFGAKPGGFGSTGGATGGFGGQGFGNRTALSQTTTIPNPAATGSFGGGFGANRYGTTPGYTAGAQVGFGQGYGQPGYGQQGMQHLNEPILHTSINKDPYGSLPKMLRENTSSPKIGAGTTEASKVAATTVKKKPTHMLPHYKLTPRSELSTRHRSVIGSVSDLDRERSGRDMFVSKIGGIKKLVIEPSEADGSPLFNPEVRARTRAGSAAPTPGGPFSITTERSALPHIQISSPSTFNTPSRFPATGTTTQPISLVSTPSKLATSPLGSDKHAPTLTTPGCYTKPSLDELRRMSVAELSCIENFTVGHQKYGSVMWPGKTDVRGLDLDKLVYFYPNLVEVYPEDSFPKGSPPDGVLNKLAIVTLLNLNTEEVLASSGHMSEKDKNNDELVEKELKKLTSDFQGRFKSWEPRTKAWSFEVDHFTRYGILKEKTPTTTVNIPVSQSRGSSAFPSKHSSRQPSPSSSLVKTPSQRSLESQLLSDDDDEDEDDEDGYNEEEEDEFEEDEELEEGYGESNSDLFESESMEEGYEDEDEQDEGVEENSMEDMTSHSRSHESQSVESSRASPRKRKAKHRPISFVQELDEYQAEELGTDRFPTQNASQFASNIGLNSSKLQSMQQSFFSSPQQAKFQTSKKTFTPTRPTIDNQSQQLPSYRQHAQKNEQNEEIWSQHLTKRFRSSKTPGPGFSEVQLKVPIAQTQRGLFNAPTSTNNAFPLKKKENIETEIENQISSELLQNQASTQQKEKKEFAQVPLSNSITNGHSETLVDPGLVLGRSFRVSWAPGGLLIHSGRIVHASTPSNDHSNNNNQKKIEGTKVEQAAVELNSQFSRIKISKVFISPCNSIQHQLPILKAHKRRATFDYQSRMSEDGREESSLPFVSLRQNWNSFVDDQIERSSSKIDKMTKENPPSIYSEKYEMYLKICHENDVWKLVKTLFCEPEIVLRNPETGDTFEHTSAARHAEHMVRRHQLDGFLEEYNSNLTKEDLLNLIAEKSQNYSKTKFSPSISSISSSNGLLSKEEEQKWQILYLLLVGKRIEECVELASKMGEIRLSLLLAQACDPTMLHEDMTKQLESWSTNGLLRPDILAPIKLSVYSILAGQVGVISATFDDWLRAFSCFFWYGFKNTIATPIEMVVKKYNEHVFGNQFSHGSLEIDKNAPKPSVADPLKLSIPIPAYQRLLPAKKLSNLLGGYFNEDILEMEGVQALKRDVKFDALFHLLNLFADRSYPLEKIVHPLSCSPRLLDHSLSWYLYSVLDSTNLFVNLERSIDLIFDFAAQLEICGLFEWSIYVLLSIPLSDNREMAVLEDLSHVRERSIKYYLSKNVEQIEKPEIAKFLKELQIPQTWICEAKATYYAYTGQWKKQIDMLIEIGQLEEAHNLLINKWAPKVIFQFGVSNPSLWPSEFISTLNRFKNSSQSNLISNWTYGASIYLEYAEITGKVLKLKSLMKSDAFSSNLDVELLNSMPQINSQIMSFIQKMNEWNSMIQQLIQRVESHAKQNLGRTDFKPILPLTGNAGAAALRRFNMNLKELMNEAVCASEMSSQLIKTFELLKTLLACANLQIALPLNPDSTLVPLQIGDTLDMLLPLQATIIPEDVRASSLSQLTTRYLNWRVASN